MALTAVMMDYYACYAMLLENLPFLGLIGAEGKTITSRDCVFTYLLCMQELPSRTKETR